MSQVSNGDVVLRKVEKGAVGLNGPKALANILQAAVDSPAPLSAATLFDIFQKNGSPALDSREQAHLRFAFGDPVVVSTFAKLMIRDCLNARRRAVVRKAFAAYRENGAAALTPSNSRSTTNGSAAESSAFDVSFEVELRANQSISEDVFTAYYAGWSLFRVRTDDDFERTVLKEWNCDPHLSPRLHETERDWSASDGGADPLAATPQYAKDALSRSLGRTGKDYDSSHMRRTLPPQRTLPIVAPDYVTTTKRSYPRYSVAEMRNADPFAALQ